MDILWFKERMRQAGVTGGEIAARAGKAASNISHILHGKQPMSPEWGALFAEALDVPLATIMEKSGAFQYSQAPAPVERGFAESDAAAYQPGPAARQIPAIADAFGARPGVDIWRVTSSAMCMAGLLVGDYILVDSHTADRVQPGDLVVAQVYSRDSARTVLRRWMPPVLVPAGAPGDDVQVYVVDNDNVLIRGKVTASWRVADS